MKTLRQINAGELVTPEESAQGAVVMDGVRLVVLDAAERRMLDLSRALIARDYADQSLGLTKEFLAEAAGALSAAFPSIPAGWLADVYFASEMLRGLVPAAGSAELLAAAPPVFRANLLDELVDYKALGDKLTLVSVWSSMLEDPVKSVSGELRVSGDPRIESWKAKKTNGLELMLSIRRSEAIYLRAGVVKRLSQAEMDLERAAVDARRAVPPALQAVGRAGWLDLRQAALAAYPEAAEALARMERAAAEVPAEQYPGFQDKCIMTALAAIGKAAMADAVAGRSRDLTALAGLPPPALEFLADPRRAVARLYLRRAFA
jgi:hypothetical protein